MEGFVTLPENGGHITGVFYRTIERYLISVRVGKFMPVAGINRF